MKYLIMFLLFTYSLSSISEENGPVTSELRLKEYKRQMGKEYNNKSKEDFCKSDFDNLPRIRDVYYKIDSNFRPINESKRKHIEFLIHESFDTKKNIEYSRNIFFELDSDIDYHQISLQKDLKKLILSLENINWIEHQKILENYLQLLRGKNYYSTDEQSNAFSNLSSMFDIYIQMKEVERKTFDFIYTVNRLNKSKDFGKIIDPGLGDLSTNVSSFHKMIKCEYDYLSMF